MLPERFQKLVAILCVIFVLHSCSSESEGSPEVATALDGDTSCQFVAADRELLLSLGFVDEAGFGEELIHSRGFERFDVARLDQVSTLPNSDWYQAIPKCAPNTRDQAILHNRLKSYLSDDPVIKIDGLSTQFSSHQKMMSIYVIDMGSYYLNTIAEEGHSFRAT